jgi:DNA-binding NarL/FixJ family response regulator
MRFEIRSSKRDLTSHHRNWDASNLPAIDTSPGQALQQHQVPVRPLVAVERNIMPRVLIVDDHAAIRRGVQGILHSFPEWELCGEADNGQEAVRLAESLKPEVIIMDVSMPVLNGLEATRIISDALPQTKIVLLTLHSSTELVRSAFRAGARGYVLKSDAEQELIRALNVIQGNGTYVSPTIDEDVAKRVVEEMGKRQRN